MRFSKDTIALICTGVIVFGFFFAGVFEVLDYAIVKLLLFLGFAIFSGVVVWIAVKDSENKNHLK